MYNAGSVSYIESFYDQIGENIGRGVGVITPVAVTAYDRNTHVVLVKPLVAIDDGNRYIQDGVIRCTAWRPYAGRFLIDIPIEIGDTGWVLAADSDTDNAKANCVHDDPGQIPVTVIPKTEWSHLAQHGIFFPDRWGPQYMTDEKHVSLFNEGELDRDRLVIQSEDGKQRISIGTVGGTFDIRVDAASVVSVNAPFVNVASSSVTVKTDKMDVTASSGIKFEAPEVEFKGKVSISSGANGTITPMNLGTVTNGIVTGISK